MYDGFPLKRADATTRGDDYQYVIQSMDATMRHAFGWSAGVSITPPFSISDDGNVEILQTLSIGSAVAIDEIVDSIPLSASEDDDSSLANVTSIRAFTADYIDDYMVTQGLFVLKAGDTMTGELVADAGITATTALNLSKAVFATDPMLSVGVVLQGYGGVDLIQYDSAVVVGDAVEPLEMTGSGGRPQYKGQNVALVSDISGTIPGMDYVPEAGGNFTGLVDFDSGLSITFGNPIEMEWNTGASSFTLVEVADDGLGDVVFDSGDGTFDFLGDVLATAFDLDVGTRETVLEWSGTYIQLGYASEDVNIIGAADRPLYKGAALALLGDTTGSIADGSGITFTGSEPTTISITEDGINASHMPDGEGGQYLRLNTAADTILWEDPDIIAGNGIDVAINGSTNQVTITAADVDTAELADDAITQVKVADNAIGYMELYADRGVSGTTDGLYTLVVDTVGGVGTLEWQKAGADGIVGTLEVVEDYYEGSSESYTEVLNVTNGPYVITLVEYTTLADPNEAWIQIIIDGQPAVIDDELMTDAAPILIGNTEDAVYDFPFFAKTSVEINQKRVSGSGSVKCEATVMRMG